MSERLARIAQLRPESAVKIYLMDRGYSVWSWLCPKHLAWKKSQGWEVKQEKEPPHILACDFRSGGGRCGPPETEEVAL